MYRADNKVYVLNKVTYSDENKKMKLLTFFAYGNTFVTFR
jgi:hypothetical protein